MPDPRIRVTEGAVEIDVPNGASRGALVLESCCPHIRIAMGDATLAWARIEPAGAGFRWARMELGQPLAIVRPIRAREARDITAWPRAFAEMLVASDRAWLRPGTWSVGMLAREREAYVSLEGLGSMVRGLEHALDAAPSFHERHRTYGSGRVLSLRAVDPESARARAWRKHARDGTLPPILLGWLSALDAYVILDGHERLRAARLENVMPDIVSLTAVRDMRSPLDDVRSEAMREESRRRYALAFQNESHLSDRSRAEMNRYLAGAWDDWSYRSTATPARHRGDLMTLAQRELAPSDPVLG